ncbi:signal peptidase II [Paenibacillus pectinilyticus]|uniref:Lipoprotein signal peptidase n=1 Tax=Paenibacillus pectinilyticus TaxID=512399 RepID=A0A1C1A9E3_9BACL|nr:signal peptidase II [Paenibacillus pectinilyticus]OCT17222.1 signal peptidase II [Paenibacillus pectinilyticus]
MKYYVYALLAFILDQVTKWIIVKKIPIGEERPVIGDFFMITSSRNRGAAFGILQNQRWFFIVVTLAVLAGILWYMRRTIREGKVLLTFALTLLLGGALGNFIDRALFGEVVDFLQFTFDFSFFGKDVDYIFPIFNIADSCIVVGVILIFIESLFAARKEKKGATHEHKPDLT